MFQCLWCKWGGKTWQFSSRLPYALHYSEREKQKHKKTDLEATTDNVARSLVHYWKIFSLLTENDSSSSGKAVKSYWKRKVPLITCPVQIASDGKQQYMVNLTHFLLPHYICCHHDHWSNHLAKAVILWLAKASSIAASSIICHIFYFWPAKLLH